MNASAYLYRIAAVNRDELLMREFDSQFLILDSSRGSASDRREEPRGFGSASLEAALSCPASGGARRLEGRIQKLDSSAKISGPQDVYRGSASDHREGTT